MPLLPVSHATWQILRTVKRSKKPSIGRELRLAPTRRTLDGTFLNELIAEGLLLRVTGTTVTPFEATYSLTDLGKHAAEYGECEFPSWTKASEPPPAKKGKRVGRGSE